MGGPHVQHDVDNEGRRQSPRNWFAHDPFYRRVKDALLMLLALFGVSGMAGYDIATILRKISGQSSAETPKEGRYETGAIRSEARDMRLSERMIRVESAVEEIRLSTEKKFDKIDAKLDRLIESRWGR